MSKGGPDYSFDTQENVVEVTTDSAIAKNTNARTPRNFTRRDFGKVLFGVTGTAILTTCGINPNSPTLTPTPDATHTPDRQPRTIYGEIVQINGDKIKTDFLQNSGIAMQMKINEANSVGFSIVVEGQTTDYLLRTPTIEVPAEQIFIKTPDGWASMIKEISNPSSVEVPINGVMTTREFVQWQLVYTNGTADAVIMHPQLLAGDWENMTVDERRDFALLYQPPTALRSHIKDYDPNKDRIWVYNLPENIKVLAAPVKAPEQNQESEMKVEIIEANRQEFQNYFIGDFYGMNRDSTYFATFGIKSEEDLITFLQQNNGVLPKSPSSQDTIYLPGSQNLASLIRNRKVLEKPLDLNLKFAFDTSGKTESGELYPNLSADVRRKGDDTTALALTVDKSDSNVDHLVFKILWKDKGYDLFGKKLNGNIDNTTLTNQANYLTTVFFYVLANFKTDAKEYVDMGTFYVTENQLAQIIVKEKHQAIITTGSGERIMKACYYYPFFRYADEVTITEELPPNIFIIK